MIKRKHLTLSFYVEVLRIRYNTEVVSRNWLTFFFSFFFWGEGGAISAFIYKMNRYVHQSWSLIPGLELMSYCMVLEDFCGTAILANWR